MNSGHYLDAKLKFLGRIRMLVGSVRCFFKIACFLCYNDKNLIDDRTTGTYEDLRRLYFGRLVYPIPIKEADYTHHINKLILTKFFVIPAGLCK